MRRGQQGSGHSQLCGRSSRPYVPARPTNVTLEGSVHLDGVETDSVYSNAGPRKSDYSGANGMQMMELAARSRRRRAQLPRLALVQKLGRSTTWLRRRPSRVGSIDAVDPP